MDSDHSRTGLGRKRLPARSRKQAALYVLRRRLVAALLEERPWCEIRWDDKCEGRADQVDERLARSQGGSVLDPANCQTTCGNCHRQKHLNPTEAVARGVTIQRRSAS